MKIIVFKLKNQNQAYIHTSFVKTNAVEILLKIQEEIEVYKEINEALLPINDSDFITCRIWDNTKENKISYDFLKAKEIWKNKWREVRTPILEQLDIEFIKALETSNVQKIQEVVLKKQQLRDVTNTSLPDDLEGIKNTWPEILGPKPQ